MAHQQPINLSKAPIDDIENVNDVSTNADDGFENDILPADSMHVGQRLVPATAYNLLQQHKNLKVHKTPLTGEIKMNSVYLFDTSASDALYWKGDGKSWDCGWVRAAPWRENDTPLVRQRQSILKNNGQRVDCRRTETWHLNGDIKKPSTWKPSVVIVHYHDTLGAHGTFDVNKATRSAHGNLGKKKATQKLFNPSQPKRLKTKFHAELEDVHDEEKSTHAGFTATPKATLEAIDDLIKTGMKPAEIQRTLNLQEIYDDDGFEGPRNKKQVENRTQNSKSQTPRNDNDLADVYAFGADHPEIIRKMELLPGLLVMSRHQALENHILDVQKQVKYMIYSYDTTFDLGERFVSTLCVRHPGLLNTPVYPLRMLFHEYTDKKFTHSPFFQNLCNDMAKLNTKKTVIITDREASIKSAILSTLPRANHVFCYLHIFKNVDRWLVTNKYRKDIRSRLHFDIKNLLWSETEKTFNKLLHKFVPFEEHDPLPLNGVDEAGNITDKNAYDLEYQELVAYMEDFPDEKPSPASWDTKFQKYYMRYLDTDIRKSFRGAVVKFGIFNPHSGITTNASESINSFLQNSLIKVKKPTLYSMVNDVYDHQTSELLEIRKGLWENKGDNLIDPKFQEKRDKLNKIKVENARIVRNFESRQITNSLVLSRADDDVNYTSKYKDAMQIIEHKWLDFVRNGYWFVTDKMDKAWKVHFPTQTCDCSAKSRCVHILAVNLALAAEGNGNFENLQFAKESTITEVYKRQVSKQVGKKGRGNRVPVQYEEPGENENIEEDSEVRVVGEAKRRRITTVRTSKGPKQEPAFTSIDTLPKIPWGGKIKFGDNEKNLSLTCSLDNIMQILYVLYKTSDASAQYIDGFATLGIRKASILLKIFRKIDNSDFNRAKTIWITKLMRLTSENFPAKTAVLPLTTEESNLSHLKFLNPVIETKLCNNPDCTTSGTTTIYPMSDWIVRSPLMYSAQFNTVIIDERCDAGECTTESPHRSYAFQNGAPAFLVYALPSGGPRGTETRPSEVPETQTVLGQKYSLFAFTIHRGTTQLNEHFYTIFKFGKMFYKYDGLSPKQMDLVSIFPKGHRVSTIWMVKAVD